MIISLVIAAAVANTDVDGIKVVEQYIACREYPFPNSPRDAASIDAAKEDYVKKHGGTTEARVEIDNACELYRLGHDDGSNFGHAVERSLSQELKDAIDREVERLSEPAEESTQNR